jgi:hypothetical protein
MTYSRKDSPKDFNGYHSEWNLGSPGGWDYQRITQLIGKSVWELQQEINPIDVDLDFDHPILYPIKGFLDMLVSAHRRREGRNPGFIAVVAEEETLGSVTENRNLAEWLNSIDGISGKLMAPQELELHRGKVCWKHKPVSILFIDFNTDVLLKLHRNLGLDALLQAVRENRVVNPRGTEPINVKSTFEVITGIYRNRFHPEIVRRTPWTRQFYPRRTEDKGGNPINDLVEWTRSNWDNLVLKPERGYSGKGVRVGSVNHDADEAVSLAIESGDYIVQERIPLELWAEDIPTLNTETQRVDLVRHQTDFRSLIGTEGLLGFLGRYGGVPTNVGSGGGVQPLAILHTESETDDAVKRVNDAILKLDYSDVLRIHRTQEKMATEHSFTYLLGPIKIALRPRLLTPGHLIALRRYCAQLWDDCLTLEGLWREGALDKLIHIEIEELEIAKAQPWNGGPAIIASDGLFNFRTRSLD